MSVLSEADRHSTSTTAVLREALDAARVEKSLRSRKAAFERLTSLSDGWTGPTSLTPADIEADLATRYPDLATRYPDLVGP